MFTGIVQSKGLVNSINTVDNLARLVIEVPADFVKSLQLGASIAVNGVCLTVVSFELSGNVAFIAFDVIKETLDISNLASLNVNDTVNVERSLQMGDELGGHIVSGHVHCVATLSERVQTDTNCSLYFNTPQDWLKYILPKGFITINGISLTVGSVTESGFNVHLIPETLERTNLNNLGLGKRVNIECDQQTITIVTTIERIKLT